VLARDVAGGAVGAADAPALVVVSRLKAYISQAGDLRTSDEVASVISEEVRKKAEAGIEAAKKDGRKTVLARDVGGAG
jgi:histone H3/H4